MFLKFQSNIQIFEWVINFITFKAKIIGKINLIVGV